MSNDDKFASVYHDLLKWAMDTGRGPCKLVLSNQPAEENHSGYVYARLVRQPDGYEVCEAIGGTPLLAVQRLFSTLQEYTVES